LIAKMKLTSFCFFSRKQFKYWIWNWFCRL